jgi:hypothetical protein
VKEMMRRRIPPNDVASVALSRLAAIGRELRTVSVGYLAGRRRVCAQQHSPARDKFIRLFEENDMWSIIAWGIAVAVIVAVARLYARNDSDLGSVTETWLAEYRADQAADSK